jgi:hypothetical protein
MEVSKITAVSPKQIDWKKLTAKEIIKYDNQGVDVPVAYLQWAKAFLSDVADADNDDTTYETATKISDNQDTTANQSADVQDDASDVQENDDTLSPAKQMRKTLSDSGANLFTQARIFKSFSKSASTDMKITRSELSNVQSQSTSEIESLDTYMKQFLSKTNSLESELKSEVRKLNSTSENIKKINKLQKQLERYGIEGQSRLAVEDEKFNSFDKIIADGSLEISSALDYGTETVSVGEELRDKYADPYYGYPLARRTIKAGRKAVDNAEKTQSVQNKVSSVNSKNQNSVQSYIDQVENKTGVSAIDNSKDVKNDNSDSDSKKSDAETNATESDKAASANLDKILQAKIRKGVDVQALS